MYAYMHTDMYVCMYMYVCIFIYTYICACVCVCIYISSPPVDLFLKQLHTFANCMPCIYQGSKHIFGRTKKLKETGKKTPYGHSQRNLKKMYWLLY